MANKRTQDIELGITRFEYGDLERPQRAVLVLDTHKHYNGGLVSTASVYWSGKHSRSQMVALFAGAGGDYNTQLRRGDRTAKATQRNIDRQHAEVFTSAVVESLTVAAKDHYAVAVKAGVDGMRNTYPAAVAA